MGEKSAFWVDIRCDLQNSSACGETGATGWARDARCTKALIKETINDLGWKIFNGETVCPSCYLKATSKPEERE